MLAIMGQRLEAGAEDFPATMIEFEDRFGSEAACRHYLENLRWLEGFRCPSCGRRGGLARGHRGKLFYRLAQQAVQAGPVAWTDVAAGKATTDGSD